mmetsp:Transcript_19155/g.26378  ORF Transcript_19155/g.26378 Transcript_19155/m.26378 type:complete len:426 (+) Transcript_19155:24-1301(+)
MQVAIVYSTLLFLFSVLSQDLVPFVPEIGGTFCKYLAYRYIIPKKYFNDCPPITCNWDDWSHALGAFNKDLNASKSAERYLNSTKKERIILSYAHNGFGNQLWEHSIAFMIAESMKAKLLIAVIPDSLSPGGYIPPNTWTGMGVMEKLLPKQFLYENLPTDSSIRAQCEKEDFYISDRPVDWRSKNYTSHFRSNLFNLLSDPKPRCLKLLGYFQNLPLCAEDARSLWTPGMFTNYTQRPGPNDISIYLRCMPRHYYFNDKHFYDVILSHTPHDKVWLFQAPECPSKIDPNPAKDGLVTSVLRLLYGKYNASRWPAYRGSEETGPLLHDLAGLAQSNKMILPVSSWAHWAGLLSNASEIHVNAPPHHAIMEDMPQYIYHSEKTNKYFGRFDNKTRDVEFEANKQYDVKNTTNTINTTVISPVKRSR